MGKITHLAVTGQRHLVTNNKEGWRPQTNIADVPIQDTKESENYEEIEDKEVSQLLLFKSNHK